MPNKNRRRKNEIYFAITGLIAALVLGYLASVIVGKHNEKAIKENLEAEAHTLFDQTFAKLQSYQYGLRGARAFILSEENHESLSMESFRNYFLTRDFKSEFPGAKGFGFIRRVSSSYIDGYVKRIKEREKIDFEIKELSKHDGERYIIELIEPLEENKFALGLDIASDRTRRITAELAIESGRVQMTGPITLLKASDNGKMGLVLFMPVYKHWTVPGASADRWADAIGLVNAPVIAEDFLNALHVNQELYALKLSDVTESENSQVFFSINTKNTIIQKLEVIESVFGRQWKLEIAGTQKLLSQLQLTSPINAFLVTFFLSILSLTLINLLLNYARTRRSLFREASRLAAVVGSSSDAIIGKDIEGYIISWNQGAEDTFGWEAGEAIGKKVSQLLVPAELQTEEDDLLDKLQQGIKTINLVTRRLRKNGEEFDALVNVAPILDSKQRVVGASKTVKDISELKQAELALKQLNENLEVQVRDRAQALAKSLRENEAILKVINAQYLFSTTDKKGNIISVNENFCHASGYNADELIGKNHRILNSNFHSRDFWAQMWQTVLEGNSWRAEVCNLARNGATRWFDTVITPLMDEDGNVDRILAVRSDITIRKNTELELSAAKDQFNQAAEVAKLGVWVWHIPSNTLHWNDLMFEIYDQPRELKFGGLEYKHWQERLHPDDVQFIEQLLKDAVAGYIEFETVFRISLPNGEVRYIKAGAQVERDNFGNPERVTGINFDITDQHNLEQQLRRAKQLADDASASKTQFLANMSHEIRTPMNGVLGMLDLVKRTELNTQQRNYVNKADSAARSLLGILNDILDYSKINADKMSLDPIEFDLEDFLKELSIILAGNQNKASVEIVFDKDEKLPRILVGDKLRIMQILINLAGNALKFTEIGHVIIRLTLLTLTEGQVKFRILVEDTGIGMNGEQQSRLFQSFSQAEASTTRRFGGTGLGLAISKRLVEMMGSELHVRSEVGVGSTFWFDVLLDYKETEMTAAKKGTSKRVLLVEDNELSTEIFKKGLVELGWQIETTRSGVDALNLIDFAQKQGRPFDAIILDWNLIDIGGLDVCQSIHETNSSSAAPKIIVVTAFEKDVINSIDKFGKKTFDELLIKPVTVSQIDQSLHHSLDGQAAISQTHGVSELPLMGLRLLVVEDNELNRQIAFELLSMAGASVSVAECGIDGVSAALSANEMYDIVLMDLQMPDIDGLEATKRIRAVYSHDQLPIIAMTANAAESDRQACLAAGMNDHIGKPFDMNQLIPLIQQHSKVSTEQSYKASESPTSKNNGTTKSLSGNTSEENSNLIESVDNLLARFNGNRELAAKMRDRFETEVKKLLSNINQAFADGNTPEVLSTLHALKGVSATLGAKQLANFTGMLERTGKQGVRISADSIEQLTEISERSVRALSEIDFGLATHDADVSITQDELDSIFILLELNLREDNMNAVGLTEKLKSGFSKHPQVIELHTQVNNLDFNSALKTLALLKTSLKTNLY